MNQFGIYIHIPFCLQRCRYCDFATYSKDQIEANDDYIDHLCKEIELRKDLFDSKTLQTIYFGGGTPSLLSGMQIHRILEKIYSSGFKGADDIEITMEVNPATLTDQKAQAYRESGVNRLSIGSQTFDDRALKNCNREHNVRETLETIDLTRKYFDNFSLDLLFSLPEQRLANLQYDLMKLKELDPPHISPYCLTLPENHPFNTNRCEDSEQIEMFKMIHQSFNSQGLERYEISNYAKPGFESKHNRLYWEDQDYWGLGLSAHSYKKSGMNGFRFWNPSTYQAYLNQIQELNSETRIDNSFPRGQFEALSLHESLTDFCHTHLRLASGLRKTPLRQKYGESILLEVENRAKSCEGQDLLESFEGGWKLTEDGVYLSNRVFSEFLFSSEDVDNS